MCSDRRVIKSLSVLKWCINQRGADSRIEPRQECLEQSREGRIRAWGWFKVGIGVGDILEGESTKPVWWPPGRSHLRMEAETGARPVRVRTARIAGNRNQEECVERLFLVLPLTAQLYQQLDFRLLVSRTVRIHFYCFKASICGTSLRSSGKLPQLAWNML